MQKLANLTHPLVKPLLVAFLLLNLVVTEYGGTNAKSRGAVLRAMSESHTFAITRYKDWTIDWARRPDGEYFSNKAPGPMLVGFPLYWVLDQIVKPFENGWRDATGRRTEQPYWAHVVLMLGLQLLPFLVVCSLWASVLRERGVSRAGQIFALVAALFANTAVCFMNNNFGHGFSAILVLALGYSLWRKEYLWMGVFTGFAMLSDYSTMMQLPALALAILVLLREDSGQFIKKALHFCAGALPAAILWCWYHYVCFGSIFSLPNKFQNPDFVAPTQAGIRLFGELALPNPTILYELLFGASRGLLHTQPYLLLVPLVFLFAGRKKFIGLTALTILVWGGFLGLLAFNSGYWGWYGGSTPGPRYLCAVFPLMGFWLGLYWDACPAWLKKMLWLTLAVSVVFRALVYEFGVMVPPEPMWAFLFKHTMDTQQSFTPILRVLIFFVVLGVALALSLKNSRKDLALHG